MAKYRLGEIVQLRSGGPDMTIINVIDGENPGQWKMHVMQWKSQNPSVKIWYQTQWFDGANLKSDVFIEEALESSEE